MRHHLNESDEESGDDRPDIPVPPQPFAAILGAIPTNNRAPLYPAGGEAALSLASRSTAPGTNGVMSASRPFLLQQNQVNEPLRVNQARRSGAHTLTERNIPSSTQPAPRTQPRGPFAVTRPSSNSYLPPSRPMLPGSTQLHSSQPAAERAQPITPLMPSQEYAGSRIQSQPTSRKIPDPKETLTQLQGRSNKPHVANGERGLGSKTPAAGLSKSKVIYSLLNSYHTHLMPVHPAPFHRQMDDLPPPSPPARLAPPTKVNPFARVNAKPKKG